MIEFAICIWEPEVTEELVEELRAQGVTALEPGPSFLMNRDAEGVAADAALLRDAGIRIYSCHAPFIGDDDLSLLDEEKRRGAVCTMETAIERAARVGVECLVIHPGGQVGDDDLADRLVQLHASLEALVPKAEENGVRLALENMPPGYVGPLTTDIRAIADRVSSPFLGICLDTGHAHLNQESMGVALANVRERVLTFHVQDNDGTGDKHLQPPYGAIEWQALADGLRGMRFDKPVAVEASPWDRGSWVALLREVRAAFEGRLVAIETAGRKVYAVCCECGRYCVEEDGEVVCGCEE
jgi:sugar phosphate isomerase/epimerase